MDEVMNLPTFSRKVGEDLDELRESARSKGRASNSMVIKRPADQNEGFNKDYLAFFVPPAEGEARKSSKSFSKNDENGD